MINKVILTGRLTQTPELKYTSNNIPVVQVSLAVNRSFRNSDNQQETDFINIVLWRQRAETLAKYCQKGSLIGVEGSLQTRSYEDQQGNKRVAYDVVVDNFTFLESKRDNNNNRNYQQSYQAPQPTQAVSNEIEVPSFEQQVEKPVKPQTFYEEQEIETSNNQTVDFGDINEDDLPF